MSVLELVCEEDIPEDHLHEYFEDMYRIVCVGERSSSAGEAGTPVRSTYIADWEQLVHLLEDYTVFGEDIVEVAAVGGDEARILRSTLRGLTKMARA